MEEYKQLVESLNDTNVTKRAYDDAIRRIIMRTEEIWKFICAESDRYLQDWTYLFAPEGEIGEFDPVTDIPFVQIRGENGRFCTVVDDYETDNNPHYKYNEGFPTELLWDENWQDTIKQHIAESVRIFTDERRVKLAKNAQKREAKKQREKERRIKVAQMTPIVLRKIKDALNEEEYEFFIQEWHN